MSQYKFLDEWENIRSLRGKIRTYENGTRALCLECTGIKTVSVVAKLQTIKKHFRRLHGITNFDVGDTEIAVSCIDILFLKLFNYSFFIPFTFEFFHSYHY